MKAAVVPAVNAAWEVKSWETPKPGPNQVIIKIHASGLCYTDVHLTHGLFPLEFPRVLGHEPVGEIVELGPGVTTRKVGDRVGVGWVQKGCGRCEWCLRGKKELCQNNQSTGINLQGSHAEYMLAFADPPCSFRTRLATSRPRRSFVPDTPFGVAFALPTLSRTSALRSSALVDSGILHCSIPRPAASTRLPLLRRKIKKK